MILSELVGYFDAFHSWESDIQGRTQLAWEGCGAATLLQVFCASIRFGDEAPIDSRMLQTAETYPPELTLAEARDRYLQENGFTTETYTERWARVPLWFGLHIWVPSPKARQRALRMHDLHHVLTGYGTDLAGEAEISAWEFRRGLGGLGVYVGSIVVMGLVQGMVLRTRRTRAAYDASSTARSLFDLHYTYEPLLTRTLGDVRQELGIPREGVVATRALHADAPTS